jgi:hypothetical protein
MVMTMTPNKDPDGFAELRRLGDDVPEADVAAKARARSRLQAAIEQERAASARASMWRWGAVAAAIVAVAVATSFILRGAADRRLGASALLELAAVASTQPPPAIPPGSFVYSLAHVRATSTDVDIATGETERVVVEIRRETWIAPNGSGLILEHTLRPGSSGSERFSAEPGTLRFPNLDQLPTEPDALLKAIEGPGFLDEPEDDFGVLSGIGALLRDAYVDPAHRKALFLIVGSIEGVDVVEAYRDPLGRLGTALSLGDSGRSVTLVFQPRTSRLLEEAETHEDGAFFEATYVQTAIVKAIGERPAETGT